MDFKSKTNGDTMLNSITSKTQNDVKYYLVGIS